MFIPMQNIELARRGKAFLVHLIGSALLVGVALYWVFYIWYPFPLNQVTGVSEIFLILLLVDLALGPLLTFVVFNPLKKTLYFDLSVIVLIQLVAFGYGIWSVAEARPAWIVFSADRFDLVQVTDIDNRRISDAPKQYRSISWLGPQWVSASSPSDAEERKAILMEAVLAGVDLAQRPNLYNSLESAKEKVVSKSRPLELLGEYNETGDVDRVKKLWPEANAWLPLKGKKGAAVVLIEKSSARIVATVDLRPWG